MWWINDRRKTERHPLAVEDQEKEIPALLDGERIIPAPGEMTILKEIGRKCYLPEIDKEM